MGPDSLKSHRSIYLRPHRNMVLEPLKVKYLLGHTCSVSLCAGAENPTWQCHRFAWNTGCSNGNWTLDLIPAKQVTCHWVIPVPSLSHYLAMMFFGVSDFFSSGHQQAYLWENDWLKALWPLRVQSHFHLVAHKHLQPQENKESIW